MANRPVISEEYKLMLDTERFKDRGRGMEVFFGLLKFFIDKEGDKIVTEKKKGGPVGVQGDEERRPASYFDTPEFAPRQAGHSLRLRDERADSGKFRINLKHGDHDR